MVRSCVMSTATDTASARAAGADAASSRAKAPRVLRSPLHCMRVLLFGKTFVDNVILDTSGAAGFAGPLRGASKGTADYAPPRPGPQRGGSGVGYRSVAAVLKRSITMPAARGQHGSPA